MLANLRLSLGEAIFLMALFFGQLLSPTLVEKLPGGTFMGLPGHEMHQVFSMMYVAAALALVGAVVLVVLAALGGDPWKVVSVSIYGLTLVLLYTFSVLYHSLRGKAKGVLQKLRYLSNICPVTVFNISNGCNETAVFIVKVGCKIGFRKLGAVKHWRGFNIRLCYSNPCAKQRKAQEHNSKT